MNVSSQLPSPVYFPFLVNFAALQNMGYKHVCEGTDDMPAHIKCALIGATLSVPITDGKLNLGTWQGVWLCEHRDSGGRNHICPVY